MSAINPNAIGGAIANLKAAADIIEVVDDNNVYYGFCKPGTTATSEARWTILKITVTGASPAAVVTSFKWANGAQSYNLKWDDRATYTYSFRKF